MIPDTEVRIRTEIDAEEIEASFVPRVNPEVGWVEIEGEAVLLVEGTTRLHWLNPTGTVVWRCLDGSVSIDQLSDQLSSSFGVEREVIYNDVLDVVREFGSAGLLDGVAWEEPHQHQHQQGPQGLEIGTALQPFTLTSLDGSDTSLEDLAGSRLLLVNWRPGCGFCSKIAPDLAELQPGLERRGIRLVLVATEDADSNRALLDEAGLGCLLLLNDGMKVQEFQGLGTPCAYLVDEHGKTASELLMGADRVPAFAGELAAGTAD